mgnify:CR=1 FL=1
MSLIEHAEREMRLAGLYDDDSDYGGMIPEAVMTLVKAVSGQGHSGGSISVVLAVFDKIVRFKPLTTLTSNPEDWIDRTDISGRPSWQSIRNATVFSEDGGKTWYDIEDPEEENWPKAKKTVR